MTDVARIQRMINDSIKSAQEGLLEDLEHDLEKEMQMVDDMDYSTKNALERVHNALFNRRMSLMMEG